MAVLKEPFGQTRDGQAVDKYVLRAGGLEAEIITFGATIRRLFVPDRAGNLVDVVLGYDSVRGYEENGGYLGALVGRYANRISGPSCAVDGKSLPPGGQRGPSKQLHGGTRGFSYRVFDAEQSGESAVTFTLVSADGEGLPGTLTLRATYELRPEGLRLRYEAACDQATYCNITNHSYFNLNGGGSAMGHRLWLGASRYTPVGTDSIPISMSRPVAGSPFDFTAEKIIGRDVDADDQQLKNVGGYDHNFVLDGAQGLRRAAKLTGDKTGIVLEVWTEKPGIQLYTANMLRTDSSGKAGESYRPRQAVCLETQFFPDSPNHPEWGDIVLRPDHRYDYTTDFRFYTV